MQWFDFGILLLIFGAVFKAVQYHRSSGNNGGCHGSCNGCSQQCSLRNGNIRKQPKETKEKHLLIS